MRRAGFSPSLEIVTHLPSNASMAKSGPSKVHLLFDSVGKSIIGFFGYGGKEAELKASYDQYGVLIIFLKGVTPIPFKLVTSVSGFMKFSIPIFIAACIVTRGVRFFL